MMDTKYKYYAFISYNSRDTEWGKRLQRKLEHYRMPAALCSEHGWTRTPINPVFFAPSDIQPGGITEEIQQRLRDSRNLIVICSPNSAKSEWVGREIEYFHNLGRTDRIYFFTIDGVPHSGNPDTECFNHVVDKIGIPEILSANIHEKIYRWNWLNKERAYVQLISKLLGVEFDSIWRRHRRLLFRRMIACALGVIAVLASIIGVWSFSQPVDVTVRLNEASIYNRHLPPLKDAVITMTLENEIKTDTLTSLGSQIVFTNIPHRCLNQLVHVSVSCRDFLDVDTSLVMQKQMALNIRRDPSVYGDVLFRLWNLRTEKPLPDTELMVAGRNVTTDAEGYVSLFVPLEEQSENYPVSISRLSNV